MGRVTWRGSYRLSPVRPDRRKQTAAEIQEAVTVRNDGTLIIQGEKPSTEDAADFLEICTKVRQGIADLEAGNVYEEDEAFAILEAKFGKI